MGLGAAVDVPLAAGVARAGPVEDLGDVAAAELARGRRFAAAELPFPERKSALFSMKMRVNLSF